MDVWPRLKRGGHEGSAVDAPFDQRISALRNRALIWMSRYLAFNIEVEPPAPEPDIPEVEAVPVAPSPVQARPRDRSDASPALRAESQVTRSIPKFDVGDRIADVYDVQEVL